MFRGCLIRSFLARFVTACYTFLYLVKLFKDVGVLLSNSQQSNCRALRLSAALFPVLKCTYADPKKTCKG